MTDSGDFTDACLRALLRYVAVAVVFMAAWTVLAIFFFIAHTLVWLLGGAPRPPWEVVLG